MHGQGAPLRSDAVYLNDELPLSVRMRAAIEAAPYYHPKLSVVTSVDDRDGTFAMRLDRAIERSGMTAKLIEATPIADKAEE
jgi:hypothetical protein